MRFIINIWICISVFLSFSLNAQNNNVIDNPLFSKASIIRIDDTGNLPSYVSFKEGEDLIEEEFFTLFRQQLKLSDEHSFKLYSHKKDRLNISHKKYRQYYKGVELAYSNIIIHIKEGRIQSFNGVYYSQNELDFKANISKEEAFRIATDRIAAEEYIWEIEEGVEKPKVDLVYLPLKVIDKGGQIIPTYRINLYAKKPLSRTLFYINISSGEIEFEENLIHTGNSEGKALTAYSDTQRVVTDSLSNVFRLVDTTRGNGVETYNCQRTRSYNSAVDFLDSNNFWNNINTQLDEYATDAHWGTERTYDYLNEIHGFNSINDSGFALKSYIHYDVNVVNAFWDGQRATYGDGDSVNSPLTTLDIVGHEITHGLTRENAGLIYANESGALNESFSDIFGTTVEFYARPNRANWLVGEDIGRSFRSMINPNDNGDPDTYNGRFWIDQNCIPTRSNDRCGVHTNSGVQNYWFYLLSEGGIGENDNIDSFDVSGIGIKKAEQIAFRNLTVYLSPSSNFDDARFFSIAAAVDLYGACSQEVESVTNAWHAVGIGEKYKTGVTANFNALIDTTYCFYPVEIDFESVSNNVLTFKWYFGNGDSSEIRNPTITFQDTGTYTVTLIADGSTCGTDTIIRTNYITIDTTLACAFYLTDTLDQVVSECEGRLYDSGGSGNDYPNDRISLFTIDVPSADFIELSFTGISLEESEGFSCNRDYIQVYDGDSTDARILGRYCSEHLPPAKLNSTSNSVTIMLFADEFGNSEGFLLNWKCMNSTQVPSTDFSSLIDTSCNGVVPFINKTIGGATAYFWDFGDGSTSTEKDPVHEFDVDGSYNVRLIGSNSIGSDTVTKIAIVTIDRLNAPIVENDTVCLNGDGGLKVNSTEQLEWYTDITSVPFSTEDSITFINNVQDTTVFVREVIKKTAITASFNEGMGAGEHSNDNDYLIFDVHKPILIEKITMNSNFRGSRPLEIRNNKGDIIATAPVSIAGRKASTNVGIELYPDTAYRMSISHRESGLFKNTSGAVYPYQIGDLVTITGSNLPATHFPYFYQWKVSEADCESNFKQASIIVDTSCVITNLEENDYFSSIGIYPNPSRGQLTISGLSAVRITSISLISTLGQQLMNYKASKGSFEGDQLEVDITTLNSGVYYLKIEGPLSSKIYRVLKIE